MRWLAPLFLIFVPFFTGVLMIFITLYKYFCCLEGPGGEWNQFSSLPSNFSEKGNLSVALIPVGSSLVGSRVLLFSPISQINRNICVLSSCLFPFSLWFGVSRLKKFQGAYNSDFWARCVDHHFRNLTLRRKNFKGTNLNLFEECFRMSQRSQYVCAGNRPENIHKNLI